jgi:N-dimethylarginine dimethylaminohydrolase
MTNRYLMCAPDHFEVAYVINPWMAGNVALGQNLVAKRQWRSLAAMLSEVAQVDLVDAAAGVPDMVFTANAGLVLGNTVVLSRFRHPERQGEEAHYARWFAAQGFKVVALAPELSFEGAGDALLDRREPLLWAAHGHRSSSQCAPLLANLLDIEVEPLKLVDARFYHLDTCFCPLDGGDLMYYPPAFDAASQARIEARVPAKQRIAVSDADALDFACNAVNCERSVLLNKASPELVRELQAKGYAVRQTPLTEFMKAGGSAKCLTLKLNEPPPAIARRAA